MKSITDNYIVVIKKALEQSDVTMNVGDSSENYDDLECSRDISGIIEACEATDSPVVTFFKDGVSQGYMIVLVGYGDESVADYSISAFTEELMEGLE